MIHAKAWVAWLIAAIVALSTTRNPLYVLLILLCIGGVAGALRPHAKAPPLPMSPVRFGLLILAGSALFNALTAHQGNTTLFLLPPSLPLIGGNITLEALSFGAINGLVLVGFLGAFTALNLALPTHAVVRLIPRAFYPVAIVISIALAFVPTTLRQLQQIREAQQVRGHRVRGIRDWLPLLLPLLVGGLERAFQLAEAMTARGFASSTGMDSSFRRLVVQGMLVLGMVSLLSGLLLRLAWQRWALGAVLMAMGSGLLLVAIWLAGRKVTHTSYRVQRWTAGDRAVVLAAAVVLAVYLLPSPLWERASIFYYPYPNLTPPLVDVIILLSTVGLLAPVLVLRQASLRATQAAGVAHQEAPAPG